MESGQYLDSARQYRMAPISPDVTQVWRYTCVTLYLPLPPSVTVSETMPQWALSGRVASGLRQLHPRPNAPGQFVIYVMDNETHDYLIFTRPKRPRLAVMYNNESTWMVPGTERADE
jgi:hypothetical protein